MIDPDILTRGLEMGGGESNIDLFGMGIDYKMEYAW